MCIVKSGMKLDVVDNVAALIPFANIGVGVRVKFEYAIIAFGEC